MRIGMLLDQAFPPDIRVEKEAKTLSAAGYEIFLLALGRGNEPSYRDLGYLKLHRVLNFRKSKFLSDLHLTLNRFTRFRMLLWEPAIKNFVTAQSIDVLHVHDLPLFKSAFLIARKLGIKVVLDLHENYPYAIREWKSGDKMARLKFALSYDLQRWLNYEKWAVQNSHKVIVVVEEMKERLMRTHKINENKIVVVPNTESLKFLKIPISRSIVEKYSIYFVVGYVGGIAKHRGLDILIRASALLKDKIPNLKVLIVGGHNKTLQSLIDRLNVNGIVEFIGKQSFELVPSYIKAFDIGVVPHLKNPHCDNTMPHKLFQYMMLSKPVVVSNCAPLKRIVNEVKSGLIFENENPDSLASAIFTLYKNENIRLELGQNGYKATVKGKLNWENTSKLLVELYREGIR